MLVFTHIDSQRLKSNLYANINPSTINNNSIDVRNQECISNILKTRNIGMVIYAWGKNQQSPLWLNDIVIDCNIQPYCLKINNNNVPTNLSRLPYNIKPMPYTNI